MTEVADDFSPWFDPTHPLNRVEGFHVDYPLVYAALKRAGHDAAKAVEILLDASRGNDFALRWIRTIRRLRLRDNRI